MILLIYVSIELLKNLRNHYIAVIKKYMLIIVTSSCSQCADIYHKYFADVLIAPSYLRPKIDFNTCVNSCLSVTGTQLDIEKKETLFSCHVG